jgi:hypothetical protein
MLYSTSLVVCKFFWETYDLRVDICRYGNVNTLEN